MLHQHMLGPSTSLSGNTNSALQSSVLSDGALLAHSQPPTEALGRVLELREGDYRAMTLAEFTRPRPLPQYHMPPGIASAAASQVAAAGSTVRVSFLNLHSKLTAGGGTNEPTSSYEHTKKEPNGSSRHDQEIDDEYADKICFNVGKELYVYAYRGTHTETDLSRPLDKRVYKGTAPTYHAFNQESATPRSCELIIGFSLGQLQIIDPLEKSTPSPVSRLYNEDRFIDKTAVTCIRWLPGEPHFFLASYMSGNIYVYDERIAPCNSNSSSNSQQGPAWMLHKEGEKYAVYTWKTKHQQKNPLWRWQIGDGAIHQFNFSGPDARMMATVGHDGFLRVFNYHSMELVGLMKSYFGGLLSLSWSPDARLIVTGGEDDLLTVYSVAEKRVVCRGQGHKSWVSQVQFDPYSCTTEEDLEMNATATLDDVTVQMRSAPSTSTELNAGVMQTTSTFSRCSLASFNTINGAANLNSPSYRVGSVGHDTCLCLWDITEDVLCRANVRRHRNSTIIAPMTTLEIQTSPLTGRLEDLQEVSPGGIGANSPSEAQTTSLLQQNHVATKTEKTKKKRFTKKAFTLARFSSGNSANASSSGSNKAGGTLSNGATVPEGTKKVTPGLTSQISCCNETRILGSKFCPGIRDVPIIEPLINKKISTERLTTLEFREDCFVTGCQEGYVLTWCRPGRYPEHPVRDSINSPGTTSPDPNQKTSMSTPVGHNSYGYPAENGVPPSRSSSSYSNNEQQPQQMLRSPNASSPSYRVSAASTSVYHRPTYAWQNAN